MVSQSPGGFQDGCPGTQKDRFTVLHQRGGGSPDANLFVGLLALTLEDGLFRRSLG